MESLKALQPFWRHLLAAVLLFLALAPSPQARGWWRALRTASLASEAGRPDAALAALEQALALEPQAGGLLQAAAQAALAAGKPEAAMAYLERAEAAGLESPALRCQRLEALRQAGDLAAALEGWQARPACPEASEGLARLAETAWAQGALAEARGAYALLLEHEPASPTARLRLGLLLAAEDPERAPEHLRAGLARTPDPLAADLVQAIEIARLEGDPAFTLAQVGQTFARAGEWRLAAAALQRAVNLAPGYVEARAYLGLAKEQLGQDGLADLQAAVEAAPQAALPKVFLGMAWLARGEPQRARAALEQAAALAPTHPAVLADLAAAYAALGDAASAEAMYRAAAENAPQDPRFWLLLARFSLEHELHVLEVGLPAARNAVALAPEDPAALDALGYAHFLTGDLLLAERLLTRAITLAPSASAYFHLGLLRAAQGRPAEALASLAAAVDLDPEGEIGDRARRALASLEP